MVSIETYSMYCLIYIIPGCIFYLIFAFHLFTKNKNELKSRFFIILRILAVVDLTELFFSCVSLRMGYLLSQMPFFQPPGKYNIVATIFTFGMVFFGSVQACLHVILAFNRFTAVLFPHNYANLWRGKYFYAIISIAFLIPALMFSWMLYFGGHVFFSPIFSSFVIDGMRASVPWLKKPYVHSVILVSTCVLAFAFDFLTFIFLKKGNLLKSNSSKYKQEFRLLTVSIAFLIVHTIFLACAIYSFVFPMHDGILLLIFLQCTTEIQCLISPFCVLLVDRKLRRAFLCQYPKTTVVSQVTTHAIMR